MAFVYDKTKEGILAVDLKGNLQPVCKISTPLTQYSILRSVVCPNTSVINGHRNRYDNLINSPPRKSLQASMNLQRDIQEVLDQDCRVKEFLLVKTDKLTLDIVYGLDHCFNNNSMSPAKVIQLESKRKSSPDGFRKFKRVRVLTLDGNFGEIVDFKGYFCEPSPCDNEVKVKFSQFLDDPPEAKVYILASNGWLGIYSIKFSNINCPEIVCIKEIELETGNKVRAVKFDLSDP